MDNHNALQLLNGLPGIMELIGNFVGLIYGTKIRILQEFHHLVVVVDVVE